MLDTRIILSGLWVATMLTYLWGDVLRIFAGDVKPGEVKGMVPTQGMWLLIAVIMLVPIVMVVLTLTLKYPAIRWANIIVAIFDRFAISASSDQDKGNQQPGKLTGARKNIKSITGLWEFCPLPHHAAAGLCIGNTPRQQNLAGWRVATRFSVTPWHIP